MTEEGLPFLILFHMKEDTESLEIFQNEVARQLISEKGRQIKVFVYILPFSIFVPSPFSITLIQKHIWVKNLTNYFNSAQLLNLH